MLQAFARIRFFSPDALLVDDSILVEISNQERIQIGPVILIYDLLADYLPIMQACIIGVDCRHDGSILLFWEPDFGERLVQSRFAAPSDLDCAPTL